MGTERVDFESEVAGVLKVVGDVLISKNAAYGDSALNPLRIFSKSNTSEQIRVRIDDKLSRLARGSDYSDEDTILDLLGYLVLLRISGNREAA